MFKQYCKAVQTSLHTIYPLKEMLTRCQCWCTFLFCYCYSLFVMSLNNLNQVHSSESADSIKNRKQLYGSKHIMQTDKKSPKSPNSLHVRLHVQIFILYDPKWFDFSSTLQCEGLYEQPAVWLSDMFMHWQTFKTCGRERERERQIPLCAREAWWKRNG